MTYILIGHKRRQGKDSVAKIIKSLDDRVEIISFAEPLKLLVADMLGVTVETLNTMKNESDIFRKTLQNFGNGVMKDIFGKNVWKDLLIQRAELLAKERGCRYIVVPDFRFPNEYIPGAYTINVTGLTKSVDTHESETALDEWKYDYVIHNIGSMADLELQTARVFQMIVENNT